ncbi:hypothetical protein CAEBREN_16261 [Caenorhabditis brenneri]|uniref:Uncharacterized protein n=1 Tax=Caenorhabditis brenneri TaxID=135651 RepID=G0MW32_CAEBE|nr:hypothetical protein CAEBREN_16261 [Caenorhabditis brenneri]
MNPRHFGYMVYLLAVSNVEFETSRHLDLEQGIKLLGLLGRNGTAAHRELESQLQAYEENGKPPLRREDVYRKAVEFFRALEDGGGDEAIQIFNQDMTPAVSMAAHGLWLLRCNQSSGRIELFNFLICLVHAFPMNFQIDCKSQDPVAQAQALIAEALVAYNQSQMTKNQPHSAVDVLAKVQSQLAQANQAHGHAQIPSVPAQTSSAPAQAPSDQALRIIQAQTPSAQEKPIIQAPDAIETIIDLLVMERNGCPIRAVLTQKKEEDHGAEVMEIDEDESAAEKQRNQWTLQLQERSR